MPEQNTRFVVEGMKALGRKFQELVGRKLAATKTAEDVGRDLERQERALKSEVAKLKRAARRRP